MPSSRILIASNTLSSSAASVTFSSIPATYTDLVLRFSTRDTYTDGSSVVVTARVRLNDSSATQYSFTRMYAQGSTAYSGSGTSQNNLVNAQSNANDTTSNTFSSNEIYIPNYTSSTNKPVSGFGVGENNSATNNWLGVTASLWSNTSAVSSIVIYPAATYNFVSGSSFFLYGLKNS